MNLEPFKYFKTLHSHSHSDFPLNRTSKEILKDCFETTQFPSKQFLQASIKF